MPQRFLFSLLVSSPVVNLPIKKEHMKFLEALCIVYGLKEKTIEEKLNNYERLGIVVDDIWTMFKRWPVYLTHSEKKISQTFETLKKCGLLKDEVCSMFKKSPQCIGISKQRIENSMETFLGLGVSRDKFVMMVNTFPPCRTLFALTLTKKTEFLVKKMNWPLKSVVSNPVVLGYNMEKRIVPRCNVIKALMSKGLIGNEIPPMRSVVGYRSGILKQIRDEA